MRNDMLKEALELHNNLNPAIWTKDETLLPEVEDRLFKIVNKFQSECYLPLDIVDVHLVGSNASFNYNSQSDLDVHIVVNFDLIDADKEILMVAYNLQKAKFNQDYDISIHGVNVEMYIEDINSMTASNGIYSLYNKKWIKKPVKKSYPTLDKRFYDTLDRLANKLRKVVSSDDEVEITKNINMLYMMRKNGLATDGEFSIGNLLFKEIRNLGLLDDLKKRLKEVQSKKLTLEELDERTAPKFYPSTTKTDILEDCENIKYGTEYITDTTKCSKSVINNLFVSLRVKDNDYADLVVGVEGTEDSVAHLASLKMITHVWVEAEKDGIVESNLRSGFIRYPVDSIRVYKSETDAEICEKIKLWLEEFK